MPFCLAVHRATAHFRETWTNLSSVDLPSLIKECPPAMAANMADLLFGRFVSNVPLFKGLSPEVMSALCLRCKPMAVTQGAVIIAEGEPGQEM